MLNRLEKALGLYPSASNFLYALCDFQTLLNKNQTLNDFINMIKNFDIKIIQYRDKINSNEIQIKNLQILKENLTIPIIINDKIDLVSYVNGLHLGQEDLSNINRDKQIAIKLIRKKIGNKLLGLSTHNETEILQANNFDIDMIGLGAYKASSTKNINNFLGKKISYLAKISIHPICAIGGVKIDDKIENIHFNVVGSGLYK